MIVGFSFNKISVERTSVLKGKVNVKYDLKLTDVVEQKLSLKDHKKGINFTFTFFVKYEPNMGALSINGDVMYFNTDKKVKEVLDVWKKNKKVPKDVSLEVLNIILARCNIKALELAEDLNLPAHIPLPKVELEKEKYSDYIG